MDKMWTLLGSVHSEMTLEDGPFESDDRRELCRYYVRDLADGRMTPVIFLRKITARELGYLVGAAAVYDIKMAKILGDLVSSTMDAKAAPSFEDKPEVKKDEKPVVDDGPVETESQLMGTFTLGTSSEPETEEPPVETKAEEEIVETKVEEEVPAEEPAEIKVDPEKVGDSFALADFGKPSSDVTESKEPTEDKEKAEESYNIDEIFS